jgi:acyl transferase domain-containing protein
VSELEPGLLADGIAVIGLAGKFPGCADAAALRDALAAGRDCSSEPVPAFDEFDAGFFGFSDDEARAADPQLRLFLETSWRAFEDAGYRPQEVDDLVGVFAAAAPSQYFMQQLHAALTSQPDGPVSTYLSAYQAEYLPAQVAYRLDLHGPVLATQAACAGSLAAVWAAASSLSEYRCDIALAGGANLTLPGHRYPEGMESEDGVCRAFDARGGGAGFSTGAGAVVLRRLEDAVASGDRIHAVLRGWALAGDGGDRAGFAVPGISGLATAVAEALAHAELGPADIGMVEAHGSGTVLGDALEVRALREVFDKAVDTVFLGSVKSTLGHLDVASGIASLIKAVLAVEHGMIPASLHFTDPNPHADFGPFTVPGRTVPWIGAARNAGVSSIGAGGFNVHVIVGPAPVPSAPARQPLASAALRGRRYWFDDAVS